MNKLLRSGFKSDLDNNYIYSNNNIYIKIYTDNNLLNIEQGKTTWTKKKRYSISQMTDFKIHEELLRSYRRYFFSIEYTNDYEVDLIDSYVFNKIYE